MEDIIPYDSEEPWPDSAAGDGNALHRRGIDQWGPDATSWSAAGPSPGLVDFQVGSLAISEINYHPHEPTTAEQHINPDFTADDFEFIELLNIAGESLDLSGLRVAEGIAFDMPNRILDVGQHVVIVNNRAAFEVRYGTAIDVIGEFVGTLSNRGERIAVVGAVGPTNPLF